MSRGLDSHRPQHDNDCASGVTDEMGYFPHTDDDGNPTVECTCGLDALLSAAPRGEETTASTRRSESAIIAHETPSISQALKQVLELMCSFRTDGVRHKPSPEERVDQLIQAVQGTRDAEIAQLRSQLALMSANHDGARKAWSHARQQLENDRAAAQPGTPGWQPIETAPTDGRVILVGTNDWFAAATRPHEGRWWTHHPPLFGRRPHDINTPDMRAEAPTHWHPLPDPPVRSEPETP